MARQTSKNRIARRCLTVVLIKPSKYDDEGYVIRHFRGVLPSNTLACLCSLTEDLIRRRILGDNLKIRIKILDDTVQKIPFGRIIRSGRHPHYRTVVALVGVQSNQFPRAADIARRFRAGGLQVLIGIESINPKNLKAVGKAQNQVQDYSTMIAAWHTAKIVTHIAYIIGFPFDTPESVEEDVKRLKDELRVGQASFFMLTPLPGSEDHARMMRAGEYMDPDLNKYDSFHETTRHPNFAPGELYATYRKAWLSFYSFEHMRQALANAYPGNYWNILRNFIWYKNSVHIEGGHPMLHGLFRMKDRTDRRPGFPIESRLTHLARRFRDVCGLVRKWTALLLEMEELWLQTRIRSKAELRLLSELKRTREEIHGSLKTAELQLAHCRAKVHAPELHIPSKLALVFRDLNFGLAKRITYSRVDIQRFWVGTRRKWRCRQIFHLHPHKIFVYVLREAQLFLLFAAALLGAQAESRENTSRF